MKRFLTLTVLFLSVAEAQRDFSPRVDLFQSQPQSVIASPCFQGGVLPVKKNVGLAVLYSLLLPGMGELYAGRYDVGKYFTIGEGALWLAFTSLELYGISLQNDARSFATIHAGVNPAGKDRQYFIDIGNYSGIQVYTETILRNRELDRLYDPSTHSWQWDTEANRLIYRELRISHDRVFNNNQFVIAAIIVNHVISAINAGRLAIAHNKRADEALLFDVDVSVLGGVAHPHGIMLSVSRSF